MERSVEQFRLDEPVSPGEMAPEETHPDNSVSSPVPFRPEDLDELQANPLRDEPSLMEIAAVKRFRIVGLMACAVGNGVVRWWRSLRH